MDELKRERIDELLKQFLEDFREGKLKINGWPEDISAYKASKATVNAYTRVLAKELPGFHLWKHKPCDAGIAACEGAFWALL